MEQSYREYSESMQDTQDNTSNPLNKLSEAANETKDRLQKMARKMQAKIDGKRTPTADKLKSAASTLHEKADRLQGGGRIAGFAHGAADKLQFTADYVREHDAQTMKTDIEEYVQKHPGRSLLAAAAAGLLIGRTIRRRY